LEQGPRQGQGLVSRTKIRTLETLLARTRKGAMALMSRKKPGLESQVLDKDCRLRLIARTSIR